VQKSKRKAVAEQHFLDQDRTIEDPFPKDAKCPQAPGNRQNEVQAGEDASVAAAAATAVVDVNGVVAVVEIAADVAVVVVEDGAKGDTG
jgi:hypothetical protein